MILVHIRIWLIVVNYVIVDPLVVLVEVSMANVPLRI